MESRVAPTTATPDPRWFNTNNGTCRSTVRSQAIVMSAGRQIRQARKQAIKYKQCGSNPPKSVPQAESHKCVDSASHGGYSWPIANWEQRYATAGAAAADGGAAGTGSSGGSASGRSTSDSDEDAEDAGAGGYQSRPRGSKAAKRDKAEDIQASRMLKASTDALSALARATSERTTVAFFNSDGMRDTPEAVTFRRAHARKLMAAAGLVVSPPGTLSSLAGKAAASTPATGADVPAEGGTTPSTPALTSTSTPRTLPAPAPAQAPAAGAALAPASPPAASITGPEPPVRAVTESAASTSAPPASADGSGAASRSRRSLVTKQAKAAAALAAASKTLDDENDGVYVVPLFNTRDSGAGHVEDKDEAEGDDSSDDETNAEYE